MSKQLPAAVAVSHPPHARRDYVLWLRQYRHRRDYKTGRGAELLTRWQAALAWFRNHREAQGRGAL